MGCRDGGEETKIRWKQIRKCIGTSVNRMSEEKVGTQSRIWLKDVERSDRKAWDSISSIVFCDACVKELG
eukprot:759450-Hanusia_phi.AAC.1